MDISTAARLQAGCRGREKHAQDCVGAVRFGGLRDDGGADGDGGEAAAAADLCGTDGESCDDVEPATCFYYGWLCPDVRLEKRPVQPYVVQRRW